MTYISKHTPASPLVLALNGNDGWILIHRGRNEIVSLTTEEARSIPRDGVIRRTPSTRFVAASIEVTDRCNVRCVHCYLDGRSTPFMGADAWFGVMDKLEAEGVIWLQLTGGEPLAHPDFPQLYARAWDLGFVLTVLTNGTRLAESVITQLLADRPPFRISVSVYGASEATYEAVTRVKGSWKRFLSGIQSAKNAGIPLRLKVVELVENQQETAAMQDLARQYGEVDLIREIMPTLSGDRSPLVHRTSTYGCAERWKGCEAGRSVFHVLPDGRVTLCKVAREPALSLGQLHELPAVSVEVLREPDCCTTCPARGDCGICPALFRLLNASQPDACRKEVMK